MIAITIIAAFLIWAAFLYRMYRNAPVVPDDYEDWPPRPLKEARRTKSK